jgi:hypothetical protein
MVRSRGGARDESGVLHAAGCPERRGCARCSFLLQHHAEFAADVEAFLADAS